MNKLKNLNLPSLAEKIVSCGKYDEQENSWTWISPESMMFIVCPCFKGNTTAGEYLGHHIVVNTGWYSCQEVVPPCKEVEQAIS